MALMAALSSELVKLGHQVDVVCIDRKSGSAHEAQAIDALSANGVKVHFLGRKRGKAGVIAAARLWWMIQRKRYDIVHSHLPMPDAMCGLARRCSIWHFVHVVTVHNTHEPRLKILNALAKGAHVAYCSYAARKRNPLAGCSTIVIPNGIPQSRYAMDGVGRVQTRQRLGIASDAKVVVAVGRMCPQKDFDTTIHTMLLLAQKKSVPGVRCLLCGDGEERERLEALAAQMGLRRVVEFLGARTDIPDLLRASDVFLSTSRYEGMPMTVLEALSAGLVCVLSSIEEHREVAESMPGCLFAARDPESMACALEAALSHPMDAELLRRSRSGLLRKHSVAHCTESYERFYRMCQLGGALPAPVRVEGDQTS